jgi:hypothetical protein
MLRRFLAAAIIAIAAGAGTARATTLAPIDFNELAATAQTVVYARVRAVDSILTAQHRVESIVTVEAIGYIKGGLGRTVMFRIPGGQIGAFRSVMVGAPTFTVGDEVVLFLASRGPALPYLVGFSQGVYRVIPDARSGVRMVIPPALINTGVTEKIVRGTAAPMSLETFTSRVHEINARARSDRRGQPGGDRRQQQ